MFAVGRWEGNGSAETCFESADTEEEPSFAGVRRLSQVLFYHEGIEGNEDFCEPQNADGHGCKELKIKN